MAFEKVLVANRGEIAIRVMRAVADLGLESVAVYPEDDETSLHTRKADHAHALKGAGAAAYLDIDGMVAAARETGSDAIHPGYGFLSENSAFARACAKADIVFIGPDVRVLDLFGDKVAARNLAKKTGVPVLSGPGKAVTLKQASSFLESLDDSSAMIIKAVGGGGGRGVRIVNHGDDVEKNFERCQSEAEAAFGNGALYVEQFLPHARHIEVQIAGDGTGDVIHLGERDCSIQRRHQKLVEIAPAPGLPASLQGKITASAVQLAEAAGYNNIGTIEFLVDATDTGDDSLFAFIEANARLQVEHTVTEEVMGVDLVRTQIEIARGASLKDLGLTQEAAHAPRGFAMQVRVNMERIRKDGMPLPSGGTLEAFDPPSGPGIRTDTFGYSGYRTSPAFDSLLAKVIVHRPLGGFADVVRATDRALAEFRIEGFATNIPFLRSLVQRPEIAAAGMYTRFVDDHAPALVEAAGEERNQLYVTSAPAEKAAGQAAGLAGASVDAKDPLAVLTYGQTGTGTRGAREEVAQGQVVETAKGPEGTVALAAPLQGTIVSVDVAEGDAIHQGQQLLVLESMKMEHEIRSEVGGTVREIAIEEGDTIYEGHALLFIEEGEVEGAVAAEEEEVDLDYIRPDLREVLDRHARTFDDARPDAVARRRARDQRTARENIYDLCDDGSFVEYGRLVLAAQRRRRTEEDLIVRSPADGMITGVGSINGDLFGEPVSRCAVLSYDYTVFAGTQGGQNHRKTDRMIDIAENGRMPLVIFTEGGGGRPGDTDNVGSGQRTFSRFAMLSGLVPMVGITSGRCFAGNASLLGCCDVIIATANSNIGMGGPAMIEGGGLGVFTPEEIGGMDVQVPNGVVDIAVADEEEAVAVARKYLSYFQGPVTNWTAHDQREMRRIIPENRLRVYNVRDIIETIADVGTVLEIRESFGHGMITSLIRVEGNPVGVVANNPAHLGGAIDSDAADKGARFMQLCDAFDIPVLHFCDTPGIMVGPEIEKTALVRHSSRMFLIGANLQVPFFTIILRKAYGLGGIAMAGGSYKKPYFTVAWPTGEFGGMGIEGSVKLGYRDDLAAIEDPEERLRVYEEMVANAYERGKALNNAAGFGVDDAIDPADSRGWVAGLLKSVHHEPRGPGKKRPVVDAW